MKKRDVKYILVLDMLYWLVLYGSKIYLCVTLITVFCAVYDLRDTVCQLVGQKGQILKSILFYMLCTC